MLSSRLDGFRGDNSLFFESEDMFLLTQGSNKKNLAETRDRQGVFYNKALQWYRSTTGYLGLYVTMYNEFWRCKSDRSETDQTEQSESRNGPHVQKGYSWRKMRKIHLAFSLREFWCDFLKKKWKYCKNQARKWSLWLPLTYVIKPHIRQIQAVVIYSHATDLFQH